MRRTQNIFFYLGRGDLKGFWWCIRYFDKYTIIDSLAGLKGFLWCKWFGHKPVLSKNSESNDMYCAYCHKYVKSISYEERQRYTREQKLKRII